MCSSGGGKKLPTEKVLRMSCLKREGETNKRIGGLKGNSLSCKTSWSQVAKKDVQKKTRQRRGVGGAKEN